MIWDILSDAVAVILTLSLSKAIAIILTTLYIFTATGL